MDCSSPPASTLHEQHAGAWPQSDPSDMRAAHMSEPKLGAGALSHPTSSQLPPTLARGADIQGSINGHTGNGAVAAVASLGSNTSSGVPVQGTVAQRGGSSSPPPAHSTATGLAGQYSSAFKRFGDQEDGAHPPQQYQTQSTPQLSTQGFPVIPPLPQPAVPAQPTAVHASNRPRGTAVVNKATTGLAATYSNSTPEPPVVPQRALTKPSEGVKNDGYDNENSDLVLRVGDVLLNHNPTHGIMRRYTIQHMLGQGTFGQVASCWCDEMQRNVAVKVIKNQPAYFHQARVEIGLLNLLNTRCDPHDERHIVRMLDSFLFRKHLCIVFEKLDVNLFELLKRNAFKGLSLPTVQSLLRQLLDSLTVLRDSSIMHCDLKPENILLKSMGSDEIKLIDFGSACFENRVVYSYIQSRFYRSPEVVLGTSYNVAIDMWSLGCVAAELFLGLPLFPGASEHDLMVRIVETLGTPPAWLLTEAKHTERYFKRVTVMPGGSQQLPLTNPSLLASSLSSGGLGPYDLASSVPRHQHQHLAQLAAAQQRQAGNMAGSVVGASGVPVSSWVLLSQGEFETRNACKAPVGKRYFMHTQLADIIAAYPMRPGLQDDEIQAERHAREAFIDFLIGVLDLDPRTRWTPRQATAHPFITGSAFTGPFQPPPDSKSPMRLISGPSPAGAGGNSSSSVHTSSQQGHSGSVTANAPIPVVTPQQHQQRSQHMSMATSIGGTSAGPGFGGGGPSGGGGLPQPSLPGSFQTSFIMGTPHKRLAVNRTSPVQPLAGAMQQSQQQQQQGQHLVLMPNQQLQIGWGGNTTSSTGGIQDAQMVWPTSGVGNSQAQNIMASGQLQQNMEGTAPVLGPADAAHAAAAAAARALAFAAFQQLPPQLLAQGGLQGYGGMPLSGLHPSIGGTQSFLGAGDMQTDIQSQGQQSMGSARLGGQAPALPGPSASTQALANIILGSTPSTPHLPATAAAAWGASTRGVGPGNAGTGASAGGGLNHLALSHQIQQGLLSGMVSSADMQNVAAMAAMAAVRQAAQQLQQNQQNAMGLMPQQMMYLRQQQQAMAVAAAAAAAAAGGNQLNGMSAATGYGLGGSMGWGQPAQSQSGQHQQNGMGGWPMPQTAQTILQHSQGHMPSGGQSMMSGIQQVQQQGSQQPQPYLHQHQVQVPYHSTPRRSSFATMAEDSESPVMFTSNAPGEPGSSQGTAAAGPAGGASPADWDPGYNDLDLVDTPGSPAQAAPASKDTSGGAAGGGARQGGRSMSSRASSGQDGAVAGGGRGGVVVNSGGGSGRLQQQSQQQSGVGDGTSGQHAASMAALRAQVQQQTQQQQPQLGLHMPPLPLLGPNSFLPFLSGGGQPGIAGAGNLMGQGQGGSIQGTGPMDMMVDHQAMGGWLQQHQQQQQQQFGVLMGGTGPLVAPASQQNSMGGTDSLLVGSLPFSGMGAAPAMQMYQVLLRQQQQQHQAAVAAAAAQQQPEQSSGGFSSDHQAHGQ